MNKTIFSLTAKAALADTNIVVVGDSVLGGSNCNSNSNAQVLNVIAEMYGDYAKNNNINFINYGF